MHRNTTFQSHNQNIPTLLSIEAHSQVSVDLRPNQLEPLISKIFMLCIELERKDIIIDQLQSQAQKNQMKKSQIDFVNRDMHVKYDQLYQENRVLIQSNVMLKQNAVNMERIIADLEMHKQRSAYNKELEEKIFTLELKLKKSEQERIQILEREKSLKRENSMLSYSVIKTSQKNRIRDLEYELSQEKMKLDAEKRITVDLRYQVEKDMTEIKNLKDNQYTIRRNYEEKIQKYQMSKATQDLKQSQCTAANEEKIVLLSQQLNRLRDELQQQKLLLRDERAKTQQKQSQLKKFSEQTKSLQTHLRNQQKQFQQIQESARKKQLELINQIQIYEQSLKNLKLSQTDLQNYLKQKQSEQQDRNRQIQRLRSQLELSQKNRDQLGIQIRKLKRKAVQSSSSQCQICKIRSSTVILSSKSIGNGRSTTMNLEQIIQQTQKLNLSNKKIQSLLNHHQISVQHSQNTTIINMSQ